jgi:16S rRNA (cytosine967-C5)-methyltransferase
LLINKSRGDVFRLAEDQAALLRAAMQMVKPGGIVVYSVCSLQREEGPEVVAQLLNSKSSPTSAGEVPAQPGKGAGGEMPPPSTSQRLGVHLPRVPQGRI